MGKVKAIYTYEQEFVIEYLHITEPICSFFEIRDDHDNLALFVIGCLCPCGQPLLTPNIINLEQTSPCNFQVQPAKDSQENKQQFEHHHHYHNPQSSKDKKSAVKQSFMAPKL